MSINKYLQNINNFDELYQISEKLKSKEKGDLFEMITYHLFRLDPRLNNNLQKIWLYNDIPRNILNDNIEAKIWNRIDNFAYMYEKLKEWIKKYGKIPAEYGKAPEEKKLGLWCSRQRAFNKKKSLDKDKVEKLNELDHWFWNKEELFDRKYDELKKWIKKNNRLPSQNSKDPNEEKMGRWCNQKRMKKKDGKLSQEKIDKLNQLPYWYWSLKLISKRTSFDEIYNATKNGYINMAEYRHPIVRIHSNQNLVGGATIKNNNINMVN